MTVQESLIYRVAVGKAVGFIIGLSAFFLLPFFITETSMTFRLGVLLWYTTVGAVIGVFGIFDHLPVLKLPMPWWLRGILLGAWMNFVLTLFAYQQISVTAIAIMGEYSLYASPYLMVPEGALVGLVIDFFATRFYGEGWIGKKMD